MSYLCYASILFFLLTIVFGILCYHFYQENKALKIDLAERREISRGLIEELKKQVKENELLANPIFQALKNLDQQK